MGWILLLRHSLGILMLGLARDKYHALPLPRAHRGSGRGAGRGRYLEDLVIEVGLKLILHVVK